MTVCSRLKNLGYQSLVHDTVWNDLASDIIPLRRLCNCMLTFSIAMHLGGPIPSFLPRSYLLTVPLIYGPRNSCLLLLGYVKNKTD